MTAIAVDAQRDHEALDIAALRNEFPILHRSVHGRPLVYLDNAATTQKPRAVLNVLADYYERYNANIHRGVHLLSQQATEAHEAARSTVQRFINAPSPGNIIFTRGTTESINLVASSWGARLQHGDEILITGMEHHSNIVPWQLAAERTGAVLRVAGVSDSGELDLKEIGSLITSRTRIVSVVHISNSLGTVNPIREIARMAHCAGAVVLVDGAQSVSHTAVDVQTLDCDFFAFSGHKLYGPTGIGVLYGRTELLESMPPWQGGGDMIRSVSFEKTTYADPPGRFEAGTPDVSGAIGLAAAIDFVSALGIVRIAEHESDLLSYGTEQLLRIPGLRLIGTARSKASILSFVFEDIHPHDIGTILDKEGIAVRTGHHCTQPLMRRFGVPATARASIGVYNTREEINVLVAGLARVCEVMR